MLSKSFLVGLLAATAMAHPQRQSHKHQHHRFRGSGSGIVPTGTGFAYGTGLSNATYTNATTTISATSTDVSVVTVTVAPLPVSSGGSTYYPETEAAATSLPAVGGGGSDPASSGVGAAGACGGTRPTSTETVTNIVTVTVNPDSTVPSPSVVAPVSSVAAVQDTSSTSSTSTSTTSDAPGSFYQPSTSYSTSTALLSASSSEATSAPAYTVPTVSAVSSAVSSATSAAAASPSTPAPSGGSSTGKRGLAYTDNTLTNLFEGVASFAYNWASTPGGAIGSGIEYMPMFWSPSHISLEDWTTDATNAINSGSKHLLSINEPDQVSQADMSFSDTAAAHIKYMNQFKGKAEIIGPAVTNGGAPMGLTFMQNFLDACKSQGGCVLDGLAVHWYSPQSDSVADQFKQHVQDAMTLASQYGVSKVYVTEFQVTGASEQQQADFLDAVLPWLDQQSGVGGYSFFMCSDGLLTTNNAVSDAIGAAYVKSA